MTAAQLRWPEGLTDDVPLPYALWQVMDLADGRYSLPEVARLTGLGEDEVLRRMANAAEWADRHVKLNRRVDDEMAAQMAQVLGSVMGPIAGVLVDEALDDLGAQPTVDALLGRLAGELDEQQLNAFAARLRGAKLV